MTTIQVEWSHLAITYLRKILISMVKATWSFWVGGMTSNMKMFLLAQRG